MDIIYAAKETKKLIDKCNISEEALPFYTKEHLRSMAQQIIEGIVTGEKSHRWLGWMQACVYEYGVTSMDELKSINKQAEKEDKDG